MDQNLLVENGHNLIDALQNKGVNLKAAVWVHNTDTNSWRLWMVPNNLKDKREFYRKVAEAISAESDKLQGMDASDTEMVSETHPAITALRGLVHVEGRSSVQMSNNMLNGFYLPDSIILRMSA